MRIIIKCISRYEKYKNKNDEHRYGTVGYSTVYLYYSYPENVRPRVSQMLILPPFQKLGVGTHLLKVIFEIDIRKTYF